MERSQTLVIDASVALKWFVEESHTEKALEVLDYVTNKALPIVPALFFYEIANVLRYKPEFGIKDIKEIHSALSGFGFRVEPLKEELADLTVELAFQYGITIYDASYIAISSRNKCDFVTADEKLNNKLAGEKVILLKEW
jgi:predicted nucleic acid-binding protein